MKLSQYRPPMSGSWRLRCLRALLVLVLALGVSAVVLTQLDAQVRTPVGTAGVGRGAFPVVEVAGLGSTGTRFARLTTALQRRGLTVLDFDPGRPGVQPLTYEPASNDEHIDDLAVRVVQPQIRAALERAHLPADQEVDVVAHSMGGLLMRYLIEKQPGWAAQVDDLVMVGTPNHGSSFIGWETRGGGPFSAVGADMEPGSTLLRSLGTTEPRTEVYTAIGGDPWQFRWLRYGRHGFDDTVPAESPFMTGAAIDTFPYLHGKLLLAAPVIDLIVRTLTAE